MARLLIVPSALEELRALAPLAARRRLVTRLSALRAVEREHRICRGGFCRLPVAGHRILYRRRADGSLVIVAITRGGETAAPQIP